MRMLKIGDVMLILNSKHGILNVFAGKRVIVKNIYADVKSIYAGYIEVQLLTGECYFCRPHELGHSFEHYYNKVSKYLEDEE